MANHRPLLLQSDKPMGGGCSCSCQLHSRVRFQHLLQYRFLLGFEIHKEDMFAVAQGLLETDKVVVGFLDSKQSTLPRAKTEQDDTEKNDGSPTGGGFRPTGKIS